MALIGAIGAARAQGAEVDIPSLTEARDHFDEWLWGDDAEEYVTDDAVMMRALGIGGGG